MIYGPRRNSSGSLLHFGTREEEQGPENRGGLVDTVRPPRLQVSYGEG